MKEINLPKLPDLVREIIQEDKKEKIPNVPVCGYSYGKTKKQINY
jgi:hypothetical protein